MSYNPTKLTSLKSLKDLATRIATDFATKTSLETELAKKANTANTLAGYGIGDAYTKAEVDGKVSSVYKPGGSVAFSALPDADETTLGMVYNVTDAFDTSEDFVEGEGQHHPAGTNVVVVLVGSAYKYDVLSGFVDLSGYAKTEDLANVAHTSDLEGYVKKVEGERLMTNTEGTKLGTIAEGATKVEASETNGNIKINDAETPVVQIATDAEVLEMLNEVFGSAD